MSCRLTELGSLVRLGLLTFVGEPSVTEARRSRGVAPGGCGVSLLSNCAQFGSYLRRSKFLGSWSADVEIANAISKPGVICRPFSFRRPSVE